MKSILLLAANPKEKLSLRIQEEEREIKDRLRRAGYGVVPINTAVAARPRDIQQAMLDFNPQIVHFSGHGRGVLGLCFEDETGKESLISTQALTELFGIFSDEVECVVLNACYSSSQARAIAKHIDYVVGMDHSIGDRAAIEFSIGFYSAIGSGKSFELAYELGCNAISLAGISEHSVPTLFLRDNGCSPNDSNQSYPLPSNDSRASEIDNVLICPEQSDDLQVTFDELVRLLKAKQWIAADQETARLLLQYADTNCHCLTVDDIENIPCSVLQEIDRFWLRYSNGRFGFSIQSEIWRQQFGGRVDVQTEQSLGSCLGWREAGEWKDYNAIFHLDPLSHGKLPCFFFSDCCWPSDAFLPSFLERISFCQG